MPENFIYIHYSNSAPIFSSISQDKHVYFHLNISTLSLMFQTVVSSPHQKEAEELFGSERK